MDLSLAQKFTVLRQQRARLYVEREHMVVNVRRNILAGFQRKLGTHDAAHKHAEMEVGRLRREVEMVRQSSSLGEVDYDRIAAALEDEFDAREQEIGDAPQVIERAVQRLNSLMTHEQTQAFQARFRRLAEKLHPDLRLTRDSVADTLWTRARQAWEAGEAGELEAIDLIAEDLAEDDPEARPEAELSQRVAELKTANRASMDEIAIMQEQWPFPLASKLPDEAWVESQREDYEKKTAALLAERDTLAEELNQILDTRPS